MGKKSSDVTDDLDLYADVSFELSEQVISRSNQRYMPTFQDIMSILCCQLLHVSFLPDWQKGIIAR